MKNFRFEEKKINNLRNGNIVRKNTQAGRNFKKLNFVKIFPETSNAGQRKLFGFYLE